MTDYATLAQLGVATIHEAAGRTGIIDIPLTQVVPGSRVAGPARIALCAAGDNTMVHAVLAHANPGDVLVLTSSDPAPIALLGELVATQAKVRDVAGVLVDGAVATSTSSRRSACRSGRDSYAHRVRRREQQGTSMCRSSSEALTFGPEMSS